MGIVRNWLTSIAAVVPATAVRLPPLSAWFATAEQTLKTVEDQLNAFLVDLRNARDHEEEESLGRSELPALIRGSPALLDAVLKLAKRDNRMRRALSAARYYSGLGDEVCARIDAVLQVPFPGAGGPRARPGKR